MIIDGKAAAEEIYEELRQEVANIDPKPGLAIVRVGQDYASIKYTGIKQKKSDLIGISCKIHELKEDAPKQDLIKLIHKLNSDKTVHGIIVQLPLPKSLNEDEIISEILPEKDVDCLHPQNLGRLFSGSPYLTPATPTGIISLLKKYKTAIDGADAVVIGRSRMVGKPMAQLLLKENATVTTCHTHTKNLAEKTKNADIVIVAAGSPGLLKSNMVKPGSTIIDVGINYEGGKMVGDVDFASVSEVADKISPVPGGVGPMTVASLMQNVLKAYSHQAEKHKAKK